MSLCDLPAREAARVRQEAVARLQIGRGAMAGSRRYLIVVLTGLADQPAALPGGRTPLEAAATPHLDSISASGRLGLADLFTAAGRRGGSETALLTLLGYDTRGLSVARGPLEAAGAGVALERDDLAMRMSFISVFNGVMVDQSAGQIQDPEAAALVKMLNLRLGNEQIQFHAGLGYRNILVMKGAARLAFETVPPHEILQQPLQDFAPYGPDAGVLADLHERARVELERHDINRVRVDLGENPANAIWLWGEGKDFALPRFSSLFPLRGCVVGAVPLILGVARKIGFDVAAVPGATGGVDTNLEGKAAAALRALEEYDLVVVHVAAINEACRQGDPAAKAAAIEAADRRLLGPLLAGLDGLRPWRLMVTTDHVTPTHESARLRGPVPVAFCGHEVEGIRNYAFTESNAARSDFLVDPGHNLLEFFLGINPEHS